MHERARMAVVGAGAAGLAAAWQLVRAGCEVVLYDARSEPGGRMRTDELDDCAVDVAVQLFGSTYGELFRLADEVGARRLLVRSAGRDALWRDGRPHGVTYGSLASLVASTALPASLKLKLATRYLPFLASHARRLDANDPAGTGGALLDDASVTEWGRSVLGDTFIELLAYPLLAAFYGGPPERVSAALYHALAKVGTDVHVYAVEGGIGALAQAMLTALLGRGAEWRANDAVRAVSADAGATRTATVIADSGDAEYDGVVVAVPAPDAAALLAADTELGTWLAGVETTPAMTVAFALDRPIDADCFGLSFPRGTNVGRTVVAACFEHRKLAGLVPEGGGLVVAYPAPMIATEAAASTPGALVDQMLGALSEVFPRLGDHVTHARVYRLPAGYTLFYPGYLRHLVRREERWLPANVALAGDYLVAPTVEGAVISGRRAAARLVGTS